MSTAYCYTMVQRTMCPVHCYTEVTRMMFTAFCYTKAQKTMVSFYCYAQHVRAIVVWYQSSANSFLGHIIKTGSHNGENELLQSYSPVLGCVECPFLYSSDGDLLSSSGFTWLSQKRGEF